MAGRNYRVHKGDYRVLMPSILWGGNNIASLTDLFLGREGIDGALNFMTHSILTSDLVLWGGRSHYFGNKVVFSFDNEGRLTDAGKKLLGEAERADVYGGAVLLRPKALYDRLTGEGVLHFNGNHFEEGERRLNRDEFRNDLLCRVLTRHPDEVPKDFAVNQDLVNESIDKVFDEMRLRYRAERMKISFGEHTEHALMRFVCLRSLHGRGGIDLGTDVLDGGNTLVSYNAHDKDTARYSRAAYSS